MKNSEEQRKEYKGALTMLDLSFLTKSDVQHLDEKIGFTAEERIILYHLAYNDMTDYGIMLELNISRNRYYKIKSNLLSKIVREAVRS